MRGRGVRFRQEDVVELKVRRLTTVEGHHRITVQVVDAGGPGSPEDRDLALGLQAANHSSGQKGHLAELGVMYAQDHLGALGQ